LFSSFLNSSQNILTYIYCLALISRLTIEYWIKWPWFLALFNDDFAFKKYNPLLYILVIVMTIYIYIGSTIKNNNQIPKHKMSSLPIIMVMHFTACSKNMLFIYKWRNTCKVNCTRPFYKRYAYDWRDCLERERELIPIHQIPASKYNAAYIQAHHASCWYAFIWCRVNNKNAQFKTIIIIISWMVWSKWVQLVEYC
jgi:hypothetical protein